MDFVDLGFAHSQTPHSAVRLSQSRSRSSHWGVLDKSSEPSYQIPWVWESRGRC